MRDLPIAWATDIAVLELSGSQVEEREGHLVVRTPQNPTFHMGNCLYVTDAGSVNDAARWKGTFQSLFPDADWIAIALPDTTADEAAWHAVELPLEHYEVLIARTCPRGTPVPDGYAVRAIAGDDWEQTVALTLTERARTRESPPEAYASFARRRAESSRAVCERGDGAYFGAFADGRLAAALGIVRCGTTARYQNVLTDSEHRRRGLASHLLGAAGRWAADRGCDRWVIVTESTNPAGRVYRAAGLALDGEYVEAYRSRS